MPDQSQPIQPVSRPVDSSRQSSVDRVEPPKRDEDRFREVMAKREKKDDPNKSGVENIDEEEGSESIFSISNKLARAKKPIKSGDDSSADLSSFEEQESDKIKAKKVDLSQETRADLAQVNPLGTASAGPVEAVDEAKAIPKTDIAALVRQMVDKLNTMTTKSETVTTLTLRFPPLFDGAVLKISEFSSAKGEFNISFEGLNPMAKRLTDLEASQVALRQSLEERGFVLHIIRTNTEIEPPTEAQSSPFAQQERQGGSQQQDDQDQG